MSKNKERSPWPYAILGIITIVVIAGGFSIDAAIHHPVQESTYFMKKYQNVEDNAYELEQQKDAFDKRFKIIYNLTKFRIGKNKLILKIIDKNSNKFLNNAKIDMLLTRPNTNDLNERLKPIKIMNYGYFFKDLDIKNLGRWKILTTIKIDKYTGYSSYDINATRK